MEGQGIQKRQLLTVEKARRQESPDLPGRLGADKVVAFLPYPFLSTWHFILQNFTYMAKVGRILY